MKGPIQIQKIQQKTKHKQSDLLTTNKQSITTTNKQSITTTNKQSITTTNKQVDLRRSGKKVSQIQLSKYKQFSNESKLSSLKQHSRKPSQSKLLSKSKHIVNNKSQKQQQQQQTLLTNSKHINAKQNLKQIINIKDNTKSHSRQVSSIIHTNSNDYCVNQYFVINKHKQPTTNKQDYKKSTLITNTNNNINNEDNNYYYDHNKQSLSQIEIANKQYGIDVAWAQTQRVYNDQQNYNNGQQSKKQTNNNKQSNRLTAMMKKLTLNHNTQAINQNGKIVQVKKHTHTKSNSKNITNSFSQNTLSFSKHYLDKNMMNKQKVKSKNKMTSRSKDMKRSKDVKLAINNNNNDSSKDNNNRERSMKKHNKVTQSNNINENLLLMKSKSADKKIHSQYANIFQKRTHKATVNNNNTNNNTNNNMINNNNTNDLNNTKHTETNDNQQQSTKTKHHIRYQSSQSSYFPYSNTNNNYNHTSSTTTLNNNNNNQSSTLMSSISSSSSNSSLRINQQNVQIMLVKIDWKQIEEQIKSQTIQQPLYINSKRQKQFTKNNNLLKQRLKCIKLISKICSQLQTKRQTLYLSIHYFDKYILNYQTPNKKLVALGCVMIGLKMSESEIVGKYIVGFRANPQVTIKKTSKSHKKKKSQLSNSNYNSNNNNNNSSSSNNNNGNNYLAMKNNKDSNLETKQRLSYLVTMPIYEIDKKDAYGQEKQQDFHIGQIINIQTQIMYRLKFKFYHKTFTYWIDVLTTMWDQFVYGSMIVGGGGNGNSSNNNIRDSSSSSNNNTEDVTKNSDNNRWIFFKRTADSRYMKTQKEHKLFSFLVQACQYSLIQYPFNNNNTNNSNNNNSNNNNNKTPPTSNTVLSLMYLLLRLHVQQRRTSSPSTPLSIYRYYKQQLSKSCNLIFCDSTGINQLFGNFLSKMGLSMAVIMETIGYVVKLINVEQFKIVNYREEFGETYIDRLSSYVYNQKLFSCIK